MTQKVRMERFYTRAQVTIVKNTCESNPLDVRGADSIHVHLPGSWTAASLGVKVSPVENTVYKPLYREVSNSLGPTILVLCSSVTANRAYALPPEACNSGFIKLWSCTPAGADVNQAADRVIGVSMKG